MYLLVLVIVLLTFLWFRTKKPASINVATSKLGEKSKPIIDKVVIIGRSISGLLQAGVLSTHAKEVIMLEQNDGVKLVAQGKHVHVLTLRGKHIVSKLFPQYEEYLKENNLYLDWGTEVKMYTSEGEDWVFPHPNEIKTGGISREIFENLLREFVKKLPNVKVLYNARVTGLKSQGNAITGVTYEKDGETNELFADLVVDCSGMHSQSPKYLQKELGIQVKDTKVYTHLTYASTRWRFYKEPPYKGYYYFCSHKNPEVIVLFKDEDSSYVLTCVTVGKTYPKSLDHFWTWLDDKKHPGVREILLNGEAVDEWRIFKKEFNRFTHFHEHVIPGFVAAGDAVCSLDPIFGQGMTCSAESALIMDTVLREFESYDPKKVSSEFQSRLASALQRPWIADSCWDLDYPKAYGGDRTLKILKPFVNWIAKRWIKASINDRDVKDAFVKNFMMLPEYANAAFWPSILIKILLA